MKRYAAWLCAALLALPALVPAQTSPAAPVPGGLCPERLARIAPAMNRLLDEGKFPGISVTVARRGAVAYRQEFGFADLAAKTPLRKDAIYRIFSMSKPVTGVAVMILLEEGRFRLDDPVSLYLPSFKGLRVIDAGQDNLDETLEASREVTIRDLLRHTSGLVYGGAPTTPLGRIYQARNLLDPATTLEQMAEKIGSIPLAFQPGSRWEYGISMDVLGRLIEVVSGQPLDVFLEERIFRPLKMVDTGFFVPDDKAERFATCYTYAQGQGLTPLPAARGLDAYRRGRNRMLSGGGGLVSTSADYLRFATMLARGGELDGVRILGPRTVSLMSSNQLPPGVSLPSWGGKNDGNGYGFTMSVTTDVARSTGYGSIGDFGWDGAASTFFRVDPKEELVVLLMTQRMPCDLDIQVKVKSLVYQALVD